MSQPTTVNKCGIKGYVPPTPSQLSRAGGNNCPNCASNYGYQICSSSSGRIYSTYELDQRRKVEIMQYKNNSAQLSKAQQYSMLSRNALTRKKSWATQTQTYTNPNVDNLPEVQIPINNVLSTVSLSCVRANNNITCNMTSDCDVPGPVIPLCVDYSVPLYNYKLQTTYSTGRSDYVFLPESTPAPTPAPTPTASILTNAIYYPPTQVYYSNNVAVNITPIFTGGSYAYLGITLGGSEITSNAISNATIPNVYVPSFYYLTVYNSSNVQVAKDAINIIAGVPPV